ncbi:MAG TPA: IS630 family transposase, partial [Verrucomicrobiae bacterium]
MAGKSKLPALVLTTGEIQRLETLSASRSAPVREVQRARLLLQYHQGKSPSAIQRMLNLSRVTIYHCVHKTLEMGLEGGIKDRFHRPKEPVITPEAKAWVVHLACAKPKELGYASELWTRQALANHVRGHASAAGHPSLAMAAKATVQRILAQQHLQPHKVKYYLERRDPEFEVKMKEVLMVYQEVMLQNQAASTAGTPPVITVSIDEKPGVQALENTAPDLPPVPQKHSTAGRDHEYKRHGTLSILASLDLHDGHVVARVEERHRSREFVALLKDLDTYYPAAATIRVILDNHSAHISKETRAYLASRPNRFKYVHTPKHGSWLNLVETLFGKMAHTFLRQIRVKSKAELKERILMGVAEINAAPVVHRWKKFDLLA